MVYYFCPHPNHFLSYLYSLYVMLLLIDNICMTTVHNPHLYRYYSSYADDTAIMASNENPTIVSNMLQRHLNITDLWTKRWKININESNSSFITFTLRKGSCPPVTMNNNPIPSYSEVKYLGLILDSKLTWNPHLKAKRKALNTRLHLLRLLLKSKMNINTKLLI